MRTVVILGGLLAVSLLGGAATAAPDSAPGESAESLIDRGVELRRQGKPAEALELLERAHALVPSARSVAQMGLAEISLHRWLAAEAHLGAALARHDSDWIETARTRETLEKSLSEVRLHIGRLRIDGTDGAEITIDGTPVGHLPLAEPLHLEPGPIRVRATAPGCQPAEKEVVVAAAEEVPVTMHLDPFPVAIAVEPRPTSPIREPLSTAVRWRRWAGAGLGVIGVAAIASGSVWLAIDGRGTCDAPAGGVCRQLYDTAAQGWIALGAGIAAAGAGTALFLWKGHERDVRLAFGGTSVFASGRF